MRPLIPTMLIVLTSPYQLFAAEVDTPASLTLNVRFRVIDAQSVPLAVGERTFQIAPKQPLGGSVVLPDGYEMEVELGKTNEPLVFDAEVDFRQLRGGKLLLLSRHRKLKVGLAGNDESGKTEVGAVLADGRRIEAVLIFSRPK